MRNLIRLITFLTVTLYAINAAAQSKPAVTQYANTTLSNLTSPTAINTNLLPAANVKKNLGSLAKTWVNLYLDSAVYVGGYTFLSSKGNVEASLNTAVGADALNANTSGGRNTATGYHALYKNTTGIENTATGLYALVSNTTGGQNVAVGVQTLENNTTGIANTAIGTYSLLFNTIGSANTVVGYSAGGFGKKISNMVAIGSQALTYLDDGGNNCTAVGEEAGFNNTTGGNNTYLGYHAGNTVTTGSSNTIIGWGADISSGTFTNATAIGNFTVSGASNRVRIGNGSVTSIGGAVGWTNFSDERIKANIKQDVPGLAFINLLKPVTYNFDLSKEEQIFKRKDVAEWKEKYDIQKIKFTGFLAQEVEAAAKKINYDFSGVDRPANDKDVYGLRYSDFVVPLVKGEQELSKQNDSLKSIVASLQNQIDELKAMITSNLSSANSQLSTVSSAVLSQNVPNPFSNSTTISCSIPQTFSSAKIIVTDKNGSALKQINLSQGKSMVKIDAATLTGGAYQYSLYVDERLVATKQFIVSK